jgi:hypothetical protein
MNNTPETIHEALALFGADYLDDNSVMSGNKAWIAPVIYDGEGNPYVVTDEREYGGDIYHLLATAGAELASKHTQLVIYTCGWAAPVGDNEDDMIAPSEHPKRIRVGLLVMATNTGLTGSAMKKQGDPELLIVGDEAKGALADAITDLWA